MNLPDERFSGYKSGFAAIAGAPNVGKSTLLNTMIGEKISITSPKPQTTRNRVVGVMHGPGFQIVFMDTPGIHKSSKAFNIKMVEVAVAALSDVDLILMVIDAAAPDSKAEALMVQHLKRVKDTPVILAVNKIDLIKKPALLGLMETWSKKFPFVEIIPVSALVGTQVDRLVDAMKSRLPAGPPYFPEDMITDMPERFIAAEMIREKVFDLTEQEVPFAVAVTIESFEEVPGRNLVRIYATIHVERNSQKGIIIGKNGRMLKSIGEDARREIERMVGGKVFLKLFVRVEKNWSRDADAMRKLGY